MTDEGNRETGLGFTSNVEDKREGSDPPLDVPHVRSQTTLPGHARLGVPFPIRLFSHSHETTH